VVTSEATIEGLNDSIEEIKTLIQDIKVDLPTEIIDQILPILLEDVTNVINSNPLPMTKFIAVLGGL
jgi:hypothetical protein